MELYANKDNFVKFVEFIKENRLELNFKNFNNKFSASKLLNDLI